MMRCSPLIRFQDTVKVPFGTKHLEAVVCIPAAVRDVHTAVILTHGAGGDMNYKQLVSLAQALASSGFLCIRFTCKGLNLSYRVKAYHAVWVSSLTQRHTYFGFINCCAIKYDSVFYQQPSPFPRTT